MAVTFTTQQVSPPGIVPAVAYADLDAIGQPFVFEVPKSGVILSATYFDQSDQGVAADLWLFSGNVAPQTDNSAFVLAPGDALKVLTVIQFLAANFRDANTAQVAVVANIGKGYNLPGRRMWAALQSRGAITVATLVRPYFTLDILPD